MGDGAVRYSNNGQSWSAGTPDPPGMVHGVATDLQGRWVAVGEDGYVAYSKDGGETWKNGDSGLATDLFAVAVGPEPE